MNEQLHNFISSRVARNGKNRHVEHCINADEHGMLKVKVGNKRIGNCETLTAARIKRDTELIKLAKAKYGKKAELLRTKYEQAAYDMERKHVLEVGYLEEQIHSNTEINKKVKWRTQQ